jgi:hypothetical protein
VRGKGVFSDPSRRVGGGERNRRMKMKDSITITKYVNCEKVNYTIHFKTDYDRAVYALGVNVEGRNRATRLSEKGSLKACKTKKVSGYHLTDEEKRMYDALVKKGLEIYKTL